MAVVATIPLPAHADFVGRLLAGVDGWVEANSDGNLEVRPADHAGELDRPTAVPVEPPEAKSWPCRQDGCERRFDNERARKVHERDGHREQVACPCGKTFAKRRKDQEYCSTQCRADAQRPIKPARGQVAANEGEADPWAPDEPASVEPSAPPIFCEECGFRCADVAELVAHEADRHGTPETNRDRHVGHARRALEQAADKAKPKRRPRDEPVVLRSFFCAKCDDRFEVRAELEAHIAERHTIPKAGETLDATEYRCDVDGCGRTFDSGSRYEHHRKVAHPTSQPVPVIGTHQSGRSLTGTRV